jgi:hypothetical protein
VRSLPGHLVEATKPAAEPLGDRAPLSPQLAEPQGRVTMTESTSEPLVAFPAGQRALQ